MHSLETYAVCVRDAEHSVEQHDGKHVRSPGAMAALAAGGTAVDVGAAPGGWTLDSGLTVYL